jgi:hypothetical protein
MPRYVLEIREPDGSTTKSEHASPENEWYMVGKSFLHEGRELRVAMIREVGRGGLVQLLECVPQD